MFFDSSQNSSLDHLLHRLPGFLEGLNSQNNVKVKGYCVSVFSLPFVFKEKKSSIKHFSPFKRNLKSDVLVCIYLCFFLWKTFQTKTTALCVQTFSNSSSWVLQWEMFVFSALRCGTITKDGMPWCHLSTWWTMLCWERVCHRVQRGADTASLSTTTHSTSPRNNSQKWPCKFTVVQY